MEFPKARASVHKIKPADDDGWGMSGRDRPYFVALHKALSEMTLAGRNLLLEWHGSFQA